MLHVAVVGSGFMGKQHAQVYRQLPATKLVAIINPNMEAAAKLAQEMGCTPFPDLAAACGQNPIDLVDVCVPTHLHEQYVIEAAQHKCHVLCEKPVTFTLESFDRMMAACQQNKVRFMAAQVARWWPEFMTIAEYLRQEKLGKIHLIYAKRLCQLPPWTVWHRDPKKSGGGLYDLNIHDIDFLVSVYGKPLTVYAAGWKTPQGCWMHVATTLAWANGVQAVVETCEEMPGPWPFTIELRACGDAGTLSYALQAGVNIADGQATSSFAWYPAGAEQPQALSAPQGDMFRLEIEEFVQAIVENRPAAVTPEQSRIVLEVILATQKSLEEGVIVTL